MAVEAQEPIVVTPTGSDVQEPSLLESAEFKAQMAAKFGEVPEKIDTTPANTQSTQEPEKPKEYFQELGFETPDDFKTEWEALKAIKDNPKQDLNLDDNAKAILDAIASGKEDELYEILDTKRQLANAANLSAEAAIKLQIKQANKKLSPEDVQDKFEEIYTVPKQPKEPVQRSSELEDEFEERMNDYKADLAEWEKFKAKVERRITRDGEEAKEALSKLSTEIKLPKISNTNVDEDYESYKASIAKADETISNVVLPAIESVKEKDLTKAIKVLDANNQMDFDVKIVPDAKDFSKAQTDAKDIITFLQGTTFDKDGNVTPKELIDLVLLKQNFDKYMQSAARQAVNAERLRVATSESGAGGSGGKNFNDPAEKNEFQKAMDNKFNGF